MKKNIAVIEGGYSLEKQVSIKSAETVFNHIDKDLYNCYIIRIDENGWFGHHNNSTVAVDKNDFSIVVDNEKITFDCAFIVIHGTPGEDGKLQAYFDLIGLPYTTCNQLNSTVTFNKFVCNQFLKNFNIPVAEAVMIQKGESFDGAEIVSKVGLPCFVKPVDGGSSFGVTKVNEANEISGAVQNALKHGTQAVIESYLNGREVTNGIFRSTNGVKVLPITEIVTDNEFFDFDAKYKGESNEITPADLPLEMEEKIKNNTMKIYATLGLSGIARADYIIHNDVPHLIEINTVPGQSAESIIPQMAAAAGIELKELFNEVIQVALSNNN